MKLNAWLRQQHSLGERLRVVERLAQALNEHHDRGEPLAALDPEHVEVNDGECDISGARRGNPAQAYCAPERAEGGAASLEADIYAAGAIAWEVLAGRGYALSPSHLAEAAADVPRELADAVMACLEQSPQWRPRDLTYVAQLAGHAQGERAKTERPARTAGSARQTPTRTPAVSRSTGPARAAGKRRESRSSMPLVVTVIVVAAAAGGSYYWLTQERRAAPAPAPVAPTTTAPAVPVASSQAVPTAAATAAPTSAPVTVAPTVAPTPAATAAPTTAPPNPAVTLARPTPPPAKTPAPIAPTPVATPPVARTTVPFQPTEPVRAMPTPPPAPPSVPTTTTTTLAPAVSVPKEPIVLSAVSPLSVRRPGKVVLDLHGSGLRPDLRARILPLKDLPRGITIVRQVCKSAGLLQLLLDLDATVAPGAYAVALEDAAGARTQSLTFTVTK